MTAGFQVWPDPPVYLKHQPAANTCHFKGATFQNIHINTPVTLTHTHTHTLLHHSINLKGLPRFTLRIGIVPFDTRRYEETFSSPRFSDLKHAAATLSASRCMRYVLLQGAEQWKWWWWILIIALESCLPEQLTCRSDGDQNRYRRVKAVCGYMWTWYIERESHVTSSIIWHLGLRLLWETVQTHTNTYCCSDNVIWKMNQCTKKMTKLSVDACVCVLKYLLYKTM